MHLDSAYESGPARTLRFLKSHSTEYLSGQDLSDVLGISRVSVWKHVKYLRDLGYGIESRQKVGYRLDHTCDEPYPWEIAGEISTRTVGRRIHYYDFVEGSTQDIAAALDADPANDGAVIIAARQSNARGRGGKTWASPRGGIWMSVVLHPECSASDAALLLPLGVGTAVAGAIRDACDVQPELRWPNDITVRGRKLAGIITEADMELDRIRTVCIGIGINFDVDAEAIEREFGGSPGFYGAASITGELKGRRQSSASKEVGKTELVRRILTRLDDTYHRLLAGQTDAITSEWTESSSTIGRRISSTTNGKTITGTAIGIADNGMLIVRRDDSGDNDIALLTAGSIAYDP